MDPNNLPSNSINKTPPPPPSPVQYPQTGQHVPKTAVAQATVVKNKSLGRKIRDTFFAEDVADLGGYIRHDILVPTIKAVLATVLTTVPLALIYGKSAQRPGYPYGGYPYGYSGIYGGYRPPTIGTIPNAYVAYNQMNQKTAATPQTIYQQQSGMVRPDDIQFNTRGEAELAKDSLTEILATYGKVTLLDFYETCGVAPNGPSDGAYGWNDLAGISVRQSGGGWVIDMPRARPLNAM